MLYPKTHLFQNIVYIIVKYRPSVLRRKYQVVQQCREVMTLADLLAHPKRLRLKGRAIYPPLEAQSDQKFTNKSWGSPL